MVWLDCSSSTAWITAVENVECGLILAHPNIENTAVENMECGFIEAHLQHDLLLLNVGCALIVAHLHHDLLLLNVVCALIVAHRSMNYCC